MSHYPGIEEKILRAIAEEGEARPPMSPRLAQEYWWMAAAQLQARGLVKVDQQAGVVRRAVK